MRIIKVVSATAVAAALGVAGLLALTGHADAYTGATMTHQAPAHTAVAATVVPSASIAQTNAFLTTVKADGGTSVLLPDGRVLWLFGDQVNAAGNGFVGRNAAAVQTGASFELLPGEFKPSVGGTVWYWPGAAVIDGGKLVILWGEQTADSSSFGSHGSGTVAVTYNATTFKVLSTSSTTAAVGGSSAVKVAGVWQVFGTRAVAGSYGKDVVRWSVPAGSFGSLSAWPASVKVLDDAWGAGTDVAVVKEGTHLRLWTKRFDIVGNDIVTAASTDATGSAWGAAKVIASPGTWTYAVHAHPEQSPDSLTYALNGNGAAQAGTYHLYAIPATT